jgi:hypothetical protein
MVEIERAVQLLTVLHAQMRASLLYLVMMLSYTFLVWMAFFTGALLFGRFLLAFSALVLGIALLALPVGSVVLCRTVFLLRCALMLLGMLWLGASVGLSFVFGLRAPRRFAALLHSRLGPLIVLRTRRLGAATLRTIPVRPLQSTVRGGSGTPVRNMHAPASGRTARGVHSSTWTAAASFVRLGQS